MVLIRAGRLLFAFSVALVWCLAASPALASALPTGERMVGQTAIEPAYDDVTGTLVYLSTPIKLPIPTKTNARAVAPLYLVLYPPGSTVPSRFNLNCEGIPGNCPDHDLAVAGAGVSIMQGLLGAASPYGTDPTLVPGHDHLVGIASSHEDFNIAWEVWEVLFTNSEAANTHLTTLKAINDAIGRGDAIKVDLGFNFHCSVVSAAVYNHGAPV